LTTRTLFAAACALALAACAGDDAAPGDAAQDSLALDTAAAAAPAAPVADEFTPIDTTQMRQTDSGLWIQDVHEGTGPALVAGQTALVRYTGWFPDGQQFDSNRDAPEPFAVEQVGMAPVIPGWNEGLQGMKVGGHRKLVVPPELGYSVAGMPPVIPPNATLVFLVELIEIR
jgi:peptidylprolyl isomerase